ncbi:hypothetical protein BDA99DRAFT_544134 [Phascolomyces articulosus]|uniref:Uncharacterized protein n=1 Tax=Phascolomyces articulosus TaxID=60185 RepID=A0AAD5P7H0_9FUNG|nr:hypothetical protein BDA99DRAFT_544134 [Phascolomyces articulosus]
MYIHDNIVIRVGPECSSYTDDVRFMTIEGELVLPVIFTLKIYLSVQGLQIHWTFLQEKWFMLIEIYLKFQIKKNTNIGLSNFKDKEYASALNQYRSTPCFHMVFSIYLCVLILGEFNGSVSLAALGTDPCCSFYYENYYTRRLLFEVRLHA